LYSLISHSVTKRGATPASPFCFHPTAPFYGLLLLRHRFDNSVTTAFHAYLITCGKAFQVYTLTRSTAITVPDSVCCFSAATATPAKEIINSAIASIGTNFLIIVFYSFHFLLLVYLQLSSIQQPHVPTAISSLYQKHHLLSFLLLG
jgi:hypothetical protein